MNDNTVYDGEIKTLEDVDRLIDSLDPSKSSYQLSPKTIRDLDELMGSMTKDVKESSHESGVRYIPEDVSAIDIIYASSMGLANAILNSEFESGKEGMDIY